MQATGFQVLFPTEKHYRYLKQTHFCSILRKTYPATKFTFTFSLLRSLQKVFSLPVKEQKEKENFGIVQARIRSASPVEHDPEGHTLKELIGVALCSAEALEPKFDFQVRKSLKPILNLQKVNRIFVVNPLNFKGALMMTTFVRLAGGRTLGEWRLLDRAS